MSQLKKTPPAQNKDLADVLVRIKSTSFDIYSAISIVKDYDEETLTLLKQHPEWENLKQILNEANLEVYPASMTLNLSISKMQWLVENGLEALLTKALQHTDNVITIIVEQPAKADLLLQYGLKDAIIKSSPEDILTTITYRKENLEKLVKTKAWRYLKETLNKAEPDDYQSAPLLRFSVNQLTLLVNNGVGPLIRKALHNVDEHKLISIVILDQQKADLLLEYGLKDAVAKCSPEQLTTMLWHENALAALTKSKIWEGLKEPLSKAEPDYYQSTNLLQSSVDTLTLLANHGLGPLLQKALHKAKKELIYIAVLDLPKADLLFEYGLKEAVAECSPADILTRIVDHEDADALAALTKSRIWECLKESLNKAKPSSSQSEQLLDFSNNTISLLAENGLQPLIQQALNNMLEYRLMRIITDPVRADLLFEYGLKEAIEKCRPKLILEEIFYHPHILEGLVKIRIWECLKVLLNKIEPDNDHSNAILKFSANTLKIAAENGLDTLLQKAFHNVDQASLVFSAIQEPAKVDVLMKYGLKEAVAKCSPDQILMSIVYCQGALTELLKSAIWEHLKQPLNKAKPPETRPLKLLLQFSVEGLTLLAENGLGPLLQNAVRNVDQGNLLSIVVFNPAKSDILFEYGLKDAVAKCSPNKILNTIIDHQNVLADLAKSKVWECLKEALNTTEPDNDQSIRLLGFYVEGLTLLAENGLGSLLQKAVHNVHPDNLPIVAFNPAKIDILFEYGLKDAVAKCSPNEILNTIIYRKNVLEELVKSKIWEGLKEALSAAEPDDLQSKSLLGFSVDRLTLLAENGLGPLLQKAVHNIDQGNLAFAVVLDPTKADLLFEYGLKEALAKCSSKQVLTQIFKNEGVLARLVKSKIWESLKEILSKAEPDRYESQELLRFSVDNLKLLAENELGPLLQKAVHNVDQDSLLALVVLHPVKADLLFDYGLKDAVAKCSPSLMLDAINDHESVLEELVRSKVWEPLKETLSTAEPNYYQSKFLLRFSVDGLKLLAENGPGLLLQKAVRNVYQDLLSIVILHPAKIDILFEYGLKEAVAKCSSEQVLTQIFKKEGILARLVKSKIWESLKETLSKAEPDPYESKNLLLSFVDGLKLLAENGLESLLQKAVHNVAQYSLAYIVVSNPAKADFLFEYGLEEAVAKCSPNLILGKIIDHPYVLGVLVKSKIWELLKEALNTAEPDNDRSTHLLLFSVEELKLLAENGLSSLLQKALHNIPQDSLLDFVSANPAKAVLLHEYGLKDAIAKCPLAKILNTISEHRETSSKIFADLGKDFQAEMTPTQKQTFGSCFKPSADLNKIDQYKDQIGPDPIIGQAFCDTKILLKNGGILTVENQNAQEVYQYLNGSAKELTHTLTIYINSWHAFFAIDGKAEGFYPNDDTPNKYRVEHTKSRKISEALDIFGINLLGADELKKTDYMLGRIENEAPWQKESVEKQYPSITFGITEEQFLHINEFLKSVKEGCAKNDQEVCKYQMLERSCLTFTQEVFGKAFPEHKYKPFFNGLIPSVFEILPHPAGSNETYQEHLYNRKAFLWMHIPSAHEIASNILTAFNPKPELPYKYIIIAGTTEAPILNIEKVIA